MSPLLCFPHIWRYKAIWWETSHPAYMKVILSQHFISYLIVNGSGYCFVSLKHPRPCQEHTDLHIAFLSQVALHSRKTLPQHNSLGQICSISFLYRLCICLHFFHSNIYLQKIQSLREQFVLWQVHLHSRSGTCLPVSCKGLDSGLICVMPHRHVSGY